VTVYRKIIVEGREGEFVVFENLQPFPIFLPAPGRKSRMAELALREFIRVWKAANGDGRTLDVPGEDAGATGIKTFSFRNGQQEVSVDDRQAVIEQGADKCVLKRVTDGREPNPLPVPGSSSLDAGQLKAQEALLKQLKANLSKARVTIQDREVDLVVQWVTHSYARNCQRPLDLSHLSALGRLTCWASLTTGVDPGEALGSSSRRRLPIDSAEPCGA